MGNRNVGKAGRLALVAGLMAVPSCAKIKTENTLKTESEIKPVNIHVVVDINIRVDRQLDDFFSFEDQFKKPATRPAGSAPTGGVK